MSRILAVVAVVVLLGAGAAVVDVAYQEHEPAETSDQDLQSELADLFGDTINIGAILPMMVLAAIALAAVRVIGG